jgi:sugar phosphate isomerase/epimerase
VAFSRDDLILSYFSLKGVDFVDRVAVASDAGFAAIGLLVTDYLRLRDEGWSDDEMNRVLTRHGVALDEIEGLRLDGSRRHEDVVCRMAEAFGASHVHVFPPYAGTIDDAAIEFGRICDLCAGRDLRAAIEFLPFTNLPDARSALEIVERADRPNGGLCIDTWHHFRGTIEWAALEALPPGRVVSVQINDGPMDPAVDDYLEDTMSNRLMPGEGEFALERFVQVLDATGVDVPYSVEIMSVELQSRDPADVARQMADRTRSLLTTARAR